MQNQFITSPSQTEDEQSSWHAIYTRHQHEKTVNNILTNKGFETFLPLYAAAHRWKDRTKVISLPLFPCYVFLKGGVERLLNIMTTPGVHSVVSSAGRPLAIAPGEIDALRLAVRSGLPMQPHQLLRQGDRVRIKAGPLTGVEGILIRHKNVCRVILSVEILGKAAAVEVDALILEALGNRRTEKNERLHSAFVRDADFREPNRDSLGPKPY